MDSEFDTEFGTNFKYKVFISYTQKDKHWAKWLEAKFESYKLPKKLIGIRTKRGLIPRRMKPVFRDVSTLSATSDLPVVLQKVLDESAALVVICSPSSAKPNPTTGTHWVDDEVKHFIDTGRQDQIFGLIVDGNPGAQDGSECFCPALQALKPLAGDARPGADRRDTAFIRILSGILGLEFVTLQEKENEIERMRLRRVFAASFVFALVTAVGAGLSLYQYTNVLRGQSNLYASYAEAQSAITPFFLDSQVALKRTIFALAGLPAGVGIMRPGSVQASNVLRESAYHLPPHVVIDNEGHWIYDAQDSPDGTSVLTSGEGSIGYVWDAATGEMRFRLDGHEADLNGAIYSPSGGEILTWDDAGIARMWDANTGVPGTLFVGHDGAIDRAIFAHSDSAILTWSEDGTARLWSPKTGDLLSTITVDGSPIKHAEFSPDKNTILTASETGIVSVWRRETKTPVFSIKSGLGRLSAVQFSTDGSKIILLENIGRISIWDALSGKFLLENLARERVFGDTEFIQVDEKLITWSRGANTAKLWELHTLSPVRVLDGHTDKINGVLYDKHLNQIITWSDDGIVIFWGINSGNKIRTIGQNVTSFYPALVDHGSIAAVRGVKVSKDQRYLLTNSTDGTIKVWDIDQSNLRYVYSVRDGGVQGVVQIQLSPNNETIISNHVSQLVIWQTPNLVPGPILIRNLFGGGAIVGAKFSPSGRFVVTWTSTGVITLWDPQTGRELKKLSGHTKQLNGTTFSQDEERLLSWSADGTVRLWTIGEAHVDVFVHKVDSWVDGAVFDTTEDRILTWADDNVVKIWDTQTTAKLGELRGHSEAINGVTFDSSGKHVVSWSDDNSVRLWSGSTFRELKSENGHTGAVDGVSFFKDTSVITSWSYDYSVRIWDMAQDTEGKEIIRHSGPVVGTVTLPHAQGVVSWSRDGTLKLWNGKPGEEARLIGRHQGEILGAALSRDAAWIVTWSSGNSVRLWHLASSTPGPILIGSEGSIGFSGALILDDGATVVAWSDEGPVMFWNAETGAAGPRLPYNVNDYRSVDFDPENGLLLTLSDDHTVRIWDARHYTRDISEIIDELCGWPDQSILQLDGIDTFQFFGDLHHPDSSPCQRFGPLSITFYLDKFGLSSIGQ